jgi:nitrogen-specific signal transduction histidine kinase
MNQHPAMAESVGRLQVHLAADLPALPGSPQQVEQVVVNLVINALEALRDRTNAVEISTAFDTTGLREISRRRPHVAGGIRHGQPIAKPRWRGGSLSNIVN